MKSPLESFNIFTMEEVTSTQDVATRLLEIGEKVGAVHGLDQIQGRGRFNREWISNPEDSLTFSFIFHDYPNHRRPYLLGMAVAIAAAGTLHCRLQWPNDLVVHNKKLGGILTETRINHEGKNIAVVGVGINIGQTEFPDEIKERASSYFLAHGTKIDKVETIKKIAERLTLLPEPTTWEAIEPAWQIFDSTPGKSYTLPTGETAIAIGIGSEGQLLASVNGESTVVYAADAILGSKPG